jgi:hypothetical protein
MKKALLLFAAVLLVASVAQAQQTSQWRCACVSKTRPWFEPALLMVLDSPESIPYSQDQPSMTERNSSRLKIAGRVQKS